MIYYRIRGHTDNLLTPAKEEYAQSAAFSSHLGEDASAPPW